MTTSRYPPTDLHDPGRQPHDTSGTKGGGHRWMMIACCVPMLAIAVVLVATGVLDIGFLFAAVACTVMMALMMRGMGHDRDGRG